MQPQSAAMAVSSNITLGLFDEGDSEKDTEIYVVLENLVNGSIDAAMAVCTIDKIIVDDCREAYESYTSMPQPTADQLEDDNIRGPNPAGWLKFLWNCVGKAAMRIPANHEGQDRLVTMLQELQKLPPRRLPWLLSDGTMTDKELWSLTPANGYEYLEQWLWELDQGHFSGNQDIFEKDAGAAAAYLNFSAFVARLLASGVCQTIRLTPLKHQLFMRGLGVSDEGRARRYEPYVCAAAQWILHAGDALYYMCEKRILVEIGKKRFTLPMWNNWKAKFETVMKNTLFADQTREWAAKVGHRMGKLEEHGYADGTKEIVGMFGFISPLDDDEEQEDQNSLSK